MPAAVTPPETVAVSRVRCPGGADSNDDTVARRWPWHAGPLGASRGVRVYCNVRGCRMVWYRPRQEPGTYLGVVKAQPAGIVVLADTMIRSLPHGPECGPAAYSTRSAWDAGMTVTPGRLPDGGDVVSYGAPRASKAPVMMTSDSTAARIIARRKIRRARRRRDSGPGW